MTDSIALDKGSSLRSWILGLVGLAAAALCLALPAAGQASFVESFDAGVYDSEGNFDPRAGAHPYKARTDGQVKTFGGSASEYVKTVVVETPAGLVLNPQAVPTCTKAEFYWRSDAVEPCPPQTQVGKIALPGVFGSPYNLYNMEPRHGVPAEFGFLATAVPVFIQGRVSADGRILAVSPDNGFGNNVAAIEVDIFGVPGQVYGTGGPNPKPLVTSPTSCVGPVDTNLEINSWQTPTPFEHWVATTPVGGTECDLLPFEPNADVQASSSVAGAPTGVDFQIDLPQTEKASSRATAHIKSVEVDLPEGMTVNPSAASGLGGCSPSEIDLDSTDPVTCPDGAKVGSVEVETPLLEEKVGGSVYLAKPYDNPFGSLLGLYVVAENAERGVRLKIAGEVEVDEDSGELTAKFEDNPQLPYETLRVKFNSGDRAPLMNPTECGTYPVTTRISPWSAADPDNPTPDEVEEDTSFLRVDSGCSDGGFDPEVDAGTVNSEAGKHSTFGFSVSRDADEREIKTLGNIELPEGLLGTIRGVALCGADEADSGDCPEASRVGRVESSVGAGPTPAWIPQAGKEPTAVYLAGPYEGAPYSLSIVVPAQAGPFDLGTLVVRTPLQVDPVTTKLSTRIAESRVYDRDGNLTRTIDGELPTFLEGIPLRVRDIRVIVDRDQFMLNPTSCAPKSIVGNLEGLGGASSDFASPFQATACGALGFKPRMALRLYGKPRRGAYQGLRAVVRARPGDANIGRVVVRMPRSAFLAQNHLNNVCTRVQWAADACPDSSIYGRAVAWSPLLGFPLRGTVHLRSSDNELPDLVADLRGPADQPVRIELAGRTDSVRGALRNTFDTVPDAPVSYFRMQLFGGPKGLIQNSRNICVGKNLAGVRLDGQNGMRQISRVAVGNPVCAKIRRAQRRKAKANRAARTAAVSAATRAG